MSMLTKAFVVLVTVLAILLVALTVSSVAQYEDLASDVQRLTSERDAARTTATLRQSEVERIRADYDRQLQQRGEEVRRQTDRVTQLAAELASARESAADARADLEKWEASLERLSAAQSQSTALLGSLSEELERRRGETVELQGRLVESSGRIAELSTQGDSLERQVRRFRERMQALMEANREIEERIAQAPPELREFMADPERAERGPTPTQPISGRIVQLDEQGREVFVQVNVGSNDGVAEQMEFMVHRGEQYLGRLVIDSVEADVAVGHMTLIQDRVQQGDMIFAGSL
ncbi:hypothetical protein ACERK3_10425 [Phycisphaerales bacterium AB-hyl4]|uniref:Chromosome partition protein Smc n=1 Tax=Natronomicrosphaera hydrolytica TaxID=3242702 RepID=A0ABV4U534_9BACT